MKCAIIIAAYNVPEYIMQCVNSVKNQIPTAGWEYDLRIGVDGCKKTADVLRKNKIPFYYSYNNVGAYVMRNSLIYLRPADLYCYFDADDAMFPEFLNTCLCNFNDVIMPGKFQCNEKMQPIKKIPIVESGGAICFTNIVLNHLGGFYNARCAADTDFMHRCEMAGYKIHKIQQGLYKRRRHNKSLTMSGKTIHGGAYRKEVWKQMTVDRQKGIIKITPRTTALEFINV
jgi:glycosyltransferase involved in cell wall biosynthesis